MRRWTREFKISSYPCVNLEPAAVLHPSKAGNNTSAKRAWNAAFHDAVGAHGTEKAFVFAINKITIGDVFKADNASVLVINPRLFHRRRDDTRGFRLHLEVDW